MKNHQLVKIDALELRHQGREGKLGQHKDKDVGDYKELRLGSCVICQRLTINLRLLLRNVILQLLLSVKTKAVLVYHSRMKMNLNKEDLRLEDKTCMILLECNIRKWRLSNVKKEPHVQHGVISKHSQILHKRMIVDEELDGQDGDYEDQIIQSNHLVFLLQIHLKQIQCQHEEAEADHQMLRYREGNQEIDFRVEVRIDPIDELVLNKCLVKLKILEVQVVVVGIREFSKIHQWILMKEGLIDLQGEI